MCTCAQDTWEWAQLNQAGPIAQQVLRLHAFQHALLHNAVVRENLLLFLYDYLSFDSAAEDAALAWAQWQEGEEDAHLGGREGENPAPP